MSSTSVIIITDVLLKSAFGFMSCRAADIRDSEPPENINCRESSSGRMATDKLPLRSLSYRDMSVDLSLPLDHIIEAYVLEEFLQIFVIA